VAEVAVAYVGLMPSAKGFGKGISNQIGGDLATAGKSGGKQLGAGVRGGFLPSIKGLMGPIAALFAVSAITSFFKSANEHAREAQKVGALTANVIKTTGGVAHVTAGHVEALSASISNMTGIEDAEIGHGANLLLTFKNVRNEVGKGANVFDRATAAAVDLSASGFGDVAGASKMLGKALNDPIKGMTALGRAGVTFSAEQKKQIEGFIKAGDLLSAQKLIMAEVESQVGGAAVASTTAADKLSNTFRIFKETIGTALLPVLDTGMTAVSGFFGGVMSSFQKGGLGQVFTDIGSKISAAWPGIQAKLGELLSALGGWIWGTALPVIGAQLAKWGIAFWAWIQPQIVPMLEKLGELLGALGTWLLNVGVPWLGEHLKTWGIAFWAWIEPMIGPFLLELGKLLLKFWIWSETVAMPAIDKKLAEWAWAFIKWIGPMIPPFLLELGKLLAKFQEWSWTVALPAVIKQLAQWALAFIKWVPGAALSLIVEMVKLGAKLTWWMVTVALPAIVRNLAGWGLAFLAWVGRLIVSLPGRLVGLLGVLTTWASGVPGKIVSALPDLGRLLYDKGRAVIQGLINGIGSMVGNLARAMADAVKKGITDLLPGSPVKKGPLRVLNRGSAGGQIVKMLAGGIDSQRAAMEASMTGLESLPRVGSLDFASSAQRSAAVGGGFDYDRLASLLAAAAMTTSVRSTSAAQVSRTLAMAGGTR